MILRLMNKSEEDTFIRLKKVSDEWNASVFTKVRIADVFSIEKNSISSELFSYALQAHFDFIIVNDNLLPQFAVEFDGFLHQTEKQKNRDLKKNLICEHFDFPLLRINSNYLNKKFGHFDLLSWLATLWFLEKEFIEQKNLGIISYDEPFDPMFFISSTENKVDYPLWLSRNAQGYLRKLFFEKKVIDFSVSHIAGQDNKGVRRGIAWILLNSEFGVFSQTAMRSQNFNVGLFEAVREISILELKQKVENVLAKREKPVHKAKIKEILNSFSEENSIRMGAWMGEISPTFR